jgi:hypothetical protein
MQGSLYLDFEWSDPRDGIKGGIKGGHFGFVSPPEDLGSDEEKCNACLTANVCSSLAMTEKS